MANIIPKIILGIEITVTLLLIGEPANDQSVNEMKEARNMSTQAEAVFEVKSWNEELLNEMENGPKLTRAHVKKSYEGDIRGEGILEYLMVHREDGTAHFVGLERIIGNLEGKAGSFVLGHSGSFENGVAKAILTIVPDTGTGKLTGIQGEGNFKSGHRRKYPVTIEYQFKK